MSCLSSSVGTMASALLPPLSPYFPRPLVSQEVDLRVALDCCVGCTLYNSKNMIHVNYNMNMELSWSCQCTTLPTIHDGVVGLLRETRKETLSCL